MKTTLLLILFFAAQITLKTAVAASNGEANSPMIGEREALICEDGFYDHYNARYVIEHKFRIYSDFSFSLEASVLYGQVVLGRGKLVDSSTIELTQDIGFGRQVFLANLAIDESRTHAKLSMDQSNKQVNLACKIEKI
ncbi:MAG: hypothetical protein PHY93_16245 [Bacteriovorax sp.]|nr:hypothetical protein [Bacteriovorax sp.]